MPRSQRQSVAPAGPFGVASLTSARFRDCSSRSSDPEARPYPGFRRPGSAPAGCEAVLGLALCPRLAGMTGSSGSGAAGDEPRRRDKLLKAADELAKHVGVKLGVRGPRGLPIRTLYRRRGPSTGQQQPRPTPVRALSETERGEVFDTLCSERFVTAHPPRSRCSEEVYLCSERTMYRVLASRFRFRNAGRSAPIPSTRSPS